MPDMTPTSLVEAIAPCTGKIIINDLSVFERGENLLQKGITLCILIKPIVKNRDFFERGLALKGLKVIVSI